MLELIWSAVNLISRIVGKTMLSSCRSFLQSKDFGPWRFHASALSRRLPHAPTCLDVDLIMLEGCRETITKRKNLLLRLEIETRSLSLRLYLLKLPGSQLATDKSGDENWGMLDEA